MFSARHLVSHQSHHRRIASERSPDERSDIRVLPSKPGLLVAAPRRRHDVTPLGVSDTSHSRKSIRAVSPDFASLIRATCCLDPLAFRLAFFAGVISIEIAPERRKLAQQFGAAEVIDPAAHDMVAAIAELTHGEGAHKTLDASSAPDARAAAVRSVRAWGTACFVGERGQVTLDVSADLLRRQVTLVGPWTFSKQGQAECAEFVAERKVDVERLFTHRWRLEQAEEAYRLFDTQTTGKAVILPS